MKREFGSIYKHTFVVLLGASMVCLLGACASNDEDANYENIGSTVENSSVDESGNGDQLPEASSGQSNNVSNGQVGENSVLSIGESYKAILLGNGDFISIDLGNKELNIKDIGRAVTDDDSITVKATKFTIIDLDDDGENEVVLWIQINGISDYGFEILHYQEETVYGYTLPYRTFFNLKKDGTFNSSNSAADPGIGKLRFSVDGYTIESVIDEAYLEEEINAAMNQQEAKTDVDWYDLSVDSVNAVF